jgi:hypothetical protein
MAKEELEKRVIAKDGRLEVTRTVLGKEDTTSDTISVRPFETNPASISVKAGATVNLGNYESARVDVMLSMPCYIEEIEEVYPKVKEWVDGKLAEEYQELKAAAKSR